MDAGDLQRGFRLGGWLVEPLGQRISSPSGEHVLAPEHMRLLLCLVERHGEAVDRRVLRECGWPGLPGGDDDTVEQAVAALRSRFGEDPRHPRYIVPVGDDGYALIAHLEPPGGPVAAPLEPSGRPQAEPLPRTLVGRLQGLIAELRRRHVFKVAASYLVGMWIVLQVAEVTFAPLHFPAWWITALTILAVLGLPIVTVLAWSYDITPGGVAIDALDAAASVQLPRARRAVAPVVVVGVAAMAAVTGFAWWRTIQTPVTDTAPAAEAGARSIAVLPFVDMSPRGGIAYLGDGLSEELSLRLAQVPGLRVAARTSAFEFKDKSLDVRKIGQSLGVRHVLEGSVRRDGERLRVTAQLVDARTGYHVWAGNYDRGWRDVLVLQDDVARAVTDALKIVLTPQAEQGLRGSQPDSKALEPYLAGLALLRRSADLSVLNEAQGRFREAVRVTPTFAPAWAGLCESGARKYRKTRDPADLAAAERSCTRALDLNASLVSTEKALGALYVSAGRYADAVPVYRRVVEHDPRNADGYIGLARAFEGRGDLASAEGQYRRAVGVEPAFWDAHNAFGGFLFAQGRYAEAARAYQRMIELAPSSATAQNNYSGALLLSGDLEGAIRAAEHALAIEPSSTAFSNLATALYYLGRIDDSIANYGRAVTLAPRDLTLWGNLADAQWQVPARRGDAMGNYRRAIALAERDQARTGRDPAQLAQLGYYYGRLGDRARSDTYLQEAVAGGAGTVYVQYFAALAAADRGDQRAAATAARAAIRLGYPVAVLRRDPGLAGIRLAAREER